MSRRDLRNYYGIEAESDLVLHHINPEWRYKDVDRYEEWNVMDVIPMTKEAHQMFHRLLHRGHNPETIMQLYNDKTTEYDRMIFTAAELLHYELINNPAE